VRDETVDVAAAEASEGTLEPAQSEQQQEPSQRL
jgi:hypothetical protein